MLSGRTPPSLPNDTQPSWSMCVTISPMLSIWAAKRTFGPGPRRWTIRFPIVSRQHSSAYGSASRWMAAATWPSSPEGPWQAPRIPITDT